MSTTLSEKLERMKSACEEKLLKIQSLREDYATEEKTVEHLKASCPPTTLLEIKCKDCREHEFHNASLSEQIVRFDEACNSLRVEIENKELEQQEARQFLDKIILQTQEASAVLTSHAEVIADRCNKWWERFQMHTEELATVRVVRLASQRTEAALTVSDEVKWMQKLLAATDIQIQEARRQVVLLEERRRESAETRCANREGWESQDAAQKTMSTGWMLTENYREKQQHTQQQQQTYNIDIRTPRFEL